MAAESNPTLAQAAMAVRAAEGRCIQAGLFANPEVSYVGDEIGNQGSQGFRGAGLTPGWQGSPRMLRILRGGL